MGRFKGAPFSAITPAFDEFKNRGAFVYHDLRYLFLHLRLKRFVHGVAPMLEKEFFLGVEKFVGGSENGAQAGGELQGDEQENAAPDGKRSILSGTGLAEGDAHESEGEDQGDKP